MITTILDNVIDDIAFAPFNREHVDNQLSEQEKEQIRLFLGHILLEASEEETAFYFECLEARMAQWGRPCYLGNEIEEEIEEKQ